MNPKGSVVRGNRAVQIRAMRLHRDGYPIRHIRRVTGVAKSTISEWIRNARTGPQERNSNRQCNGRQ